jgi:signal peptidase I
MKKNNRNLLILTLIAVAVTLLFNSLIAVYKIKGNSMSDYFTEGQYVFCLKKNFLLNFHTGNKIVFKVLDSNGKNQMLIKETIGVPGDIIKEIRQDSCYWIQIIGKNGQKKTIALDKNQPCGTILPNWPIQIVEYSLDKEYFVLGSNHEKSVDSRSFGPIKQASLLAKVLFSY